MSWSVGDRSKRIAVRWLFCTIKYPPQIIKSFFFKTKERLKLMARPLRP